MTSTDTENSSTLEDYDSASKLRQERDLDVVLDLMPVNTTSLLDVGCGIGTLIERALIRLPNLQRTSGIDLMDARIREAKLKLSKSRIGVDLMTGDARKGLHVAGLFDCITMTSVLHWMHPNELDVIAEIERHLSRAGCFILSTYHPEDEEDGLGGTDIIAGLALSQLSNVNQSIADSLQTSKIFPISKRTISREGIEVILRRYFSDVSFYDRDATMTAISSEQYIGYHAATFGGYYSGHLKSDELDRFFELIGEIAMERMRRLGWVTKMTVRLWKCSSPYGRRIDVV